MTPFVPKMFADSDRHKQFIFSTLSLKLQWHTRIYGETFHVAVAQTTQNI